MLPPDLEARFALGIVVLNLDTFDRGGVAARVTPLHHRLDRALLALEDRFDPAVVAVFYPAVDALLAGGVAGARAVVDALDGSGDEDVCAGAIGPEPIYRPTGEKRVVENRRRQRDRLRVERSYPRRELVTDITVERTRRYDPYPSRSAVGDGHNRGANRGRSSQLGAFPESPLDFL